VSETYDDDAVEIERTEEPEEEEQDLITYQIAYFPSDFTLKGYHDKWNAKQLIIPDFQRNYVWDQVQASKLIESFLLGLPVPGVFLYKERRTNRLLVIDGQQRIMSAIRFFRNEFDDRIFRLKKVHPKWDGRTFEELEEADRFQLQDAVLRATVVQQLDPEDNSSVYHIFERLNTGGIKLNPMEIRKCVYYSDFFVLLEDLNLNDDWRAIVGKPKPDKRMTDAEQVLRILAMHDHWREYEKPMKVFLNSYMARMAALDGEREARALESHQQVFEQTCAYVVSELGEKPFNIRGRLNLAVMDSVMTMMSLALSNGVADAKQRYELLLQDEQYIEDVSKNTSDTSVVRRRFSRAYTVMVEGKPLD
jgi:hypothetical protein